MFELYLAALIHSIGLILFGHFELYTPRKKMFAKVVFIHATTAILAFTVGRPWSLAYVIGVFLLGVVGHVALMRKYGIHPLTAEPKAKYYALRGWEVA
jgi:hypothetical protein